MKTNGSTWKVWCISSTIFAGLFPKTIIDVYIYTYVYIYIYKHSIYFCSKHATLTEVRWIFPQLSVRLEAQVDFAELQMGGDSLLGWYYACCHGTKSHHVTPVLKELYNSYRKHHVYIYIYVCFSRIFSENSQEFKALQFQFQIILNWSNWSAAPHPWVRS